MLRTVTIAMARAAVALSLFPAGAAFASPGPPPPEFIVNAARHVVPTQTAATFDLYAADLAGDLKVWVNGKEVTAGKEAWLALERHRLGKVDRRVLGYATGQDSILVIDQFDDRSNLPNNPHALFDPRYQTRAVQYQFGNDKMIHTIRITETDGFIQTLAQ